MSFRTPEFEAYVAPAKAYPAIWRLILGALTATIIYFLIGIGLVVIVAIALGKGDPILYLQSLETPSDPESMLMLLLTFVGMVVAAIFASFWHWRGFASLLGPLGKAFTNLIKALLIAIPLYLIIGYVTSSILKIETTENMPLELWLSYLPLVLPLLLIQTGSEELLFRGYFMQQLAARFRSPIVWFILPQLLFAAGHYNPALPDAVIWLTLGATGLFGFAAADLTRVTGNLGAAIGFHFVNNFFALLLVGVEGQMSGLSLYLAPFTMEDVSIVVPLLLLDMVSIAIVWAVLRRALRPRLQFSDQGLI